MVATIEVTTEDVSKNSVNGSIRRTHSQTEQSSQKLTKKKKDKNKDPKDEEAAEEELTVPPTGIIELFRFSTDLEVVLIFLGIFAAFLAGLCMPAMVILFGSLTNAFVYGGINETAVHIMYPNLTIDDVMEIVGIDQSLSKEIHKFGIGVSAIGAIQFVMGYIFVSALNYAAEGQVYRIRGLYLRSILRQEIGWYDVRKVNDFASRSTENMNKIQEGIGEKVGMFVFFMTTFFFSLINAFVHGWELTLVILSVFPLLGFSTGLMAKVQTALTAQELEEYSKAGSVAEEVLSSMRTVASFGGEQKEVKRYDENLIHAKRAGVKRGMMTGVGMGLMWFIIYASYALAFWYGTKLILESRVNHDDSYEPSDLVVVFFSVLMGAMNVGQSSPYVEAFNMARAAAGSIYDVIDRQSQIDPLSPNGRRPKAVEGNIELNKVYFNYPSRSEVPVLQGLNLKIEPGKTVALVGTSGCGKSTMIQLLQRFYDPLSGNITLDGHDIRDLNLGWLRDQIGIVGQEPVLFATSILDNIRYGREDVTYDEVIEASKEANAHDFIMKFSKGYETQVGERGVQMSGGQKQRIAIARALVKRPRVLLLDEATSALDNQSEAIVQKALDKVRKGRTTIIVAHRLTTIKSADHIIVLQDGKENEWGTHKELMKIENGIYKTLVTAQLSETDAHEEYSSSSISETEEIPALETILDDLAHKGPAPLSRAPSMRSLRSVRGSRRRRTSSVRSGDSRSKRKRLMKRLGIEKEKDSDEENLEDMPTLEILKMNKSEWPYIAAGVTGAAIQGALLPIYAILFGEILGTLSTADPDEAREEANFYCLMFLIIGIIAAVSMFFQSYMFALSGEILTMRLRRTAFASMLKQEMGWFDDDKNSVGALCSRLSGDASAVQGATGTRVGTIVQAITTLVTGIVLSMIFSVRLAAVTLPFIPFVLVAIYIQSKMLMGQSITDSKVQEISNKIALEAIGNIRTVAGLHKEELFTHKYERSLYYPHKQTQKLSHIRGLAFGFAQSIPFFAYAAVMFYGGQLVDNEELEYEEVFKVAEALILGTMMVGQAVAFAPNFSKAKIAAARLQLLFSRKPQIDTSPGVGLRLNNEVKSLNISDVHFTYPSRPNQQILCGLNMEVIQGQTVALVGSSGCGKSTVINLLERFYNVDKGEILMNNQNIEAVNVGFIRSVFGVVSQEPVLFDRTVAQNIAYGDNTREVSMSEIEAAAKQANIHEFIIQLPERYNTPVGAKGTQLSGGQKQRIAIARALVRNPQVLLLDEATSALDAESEKVVQDTLEQLQQTRTSIVIAHRLSTIRGASLILVVMGGQVVEGGTHDDLMEARGEYFKLYQRSV